MINTVLEIVKKLKEFYKKNTLLINIGLIIIFLAIPQIFRSGYAMGVMCRILLYSILAGSLNVINGYSGQFNLGHAGFFAAGAYFEAIMSTKLGLDFWILLPLSGLFAALVGLLVSLPTFRMKGIYLSIVTLGASEIIRLIALNWEPVTGGPFGIKSIPVPMFFGIKVSNSLKYYYIFLFIAIVFLFVTNRVLKSRLGRAWMSIREDELAAKSLGVATNKYKALNFCYGAFWAGVAGAAFAPYFKYIGSEMFALDEGFNILSMVIIGGQGTLLGPVLGSFVVNFLTEVLRPIAEYRLVAYALLIILMMWLRPQGLVGESNSILAGGKIKKAAAGKEKK